uniref:PawS-like preproalbumin 1 n=1 Tax=Monactis holwayae TaxID=1498495 RepID=A0A076EED3_9ASTR|nr:PawS-like preproalbumin 1 [Monactis holwayae]
MAKLALFALTLTAVVAFCEVSAYRTTITTTTIEDNSLVPPFVDGLDNRRQIPMEQCRSQIPMEQLNHCQMHLTQGIINSDEMVVNPRRPMQQEQQHLVQCCTQLKKVSRQCQCDAIQQVYDEARQQGGVGEMRQMLTKAQRLPTDCRLEVQECPLLSPYV